jgi:hypothetical protein
MNTQGNASQDAQYRIRLFKAMRHVHAIGQKIQKRVNRALGLGQRKW